MSKAAIYTIWIIVIIIIIAVIYWIWVSYSASTQTSSTSTAINTQITPTPTTIQLGSSASLGSYLADANGRTLYYFANDVSGKSNCTGTCLTIWAPFSAQNITLPSNLNSADFGQITNSAGATQTTYLGWPLYYYSGDKNPGDTNGEGVQNLWFVLPNPFYNIMLMNNAKNKTYLSDANGIALYYYKSDVQGTSLADPKSKCTGSCLTTVSIFDKQQVAVPALLNGGDFKEFTRSDGQAQLAYKGWPLYYYSGDKNPGDTKGDGLQGKWYLVKP